MTLIVCLDDHNGMAFHGRRQSMDKVLRSRMLTKIDHCKLWMSPYSARQFDSLPAMVSIAEDILCSAGAGDACFLETQDPRTYLPQCEKLIIYRWNRQYPAELYFPMETLAERFKLISKEDFVGSSHQRITEEIYENK